MRLTSSRSARRLLGGVLGLLGIGKLLPPGAELLAHLAEGERGLVLDHLRALDLGEVDVVGGLAGRALLLLLLLLGGLDGLLLLGGGLGLGFLSGLRRSKEREELIY